MEHKKTLIPQGLKDEIKKLESQILGKEGLCEIHDSSKEMEKILCDKVKEDAEIYETVIINKIKETNLSETFHELLFKFILKSGLTESEIYRKADIDRRLFSKIRSNKAYHPSFGTVTLLALALSLTTKEYEKLLNSASYFLPTNTYFGVTLKYCFDNRIYDVCEVNNLVYTVTGKEIKELI